MSELGFVDLLNAVARDANGAREHEMAFPAERGLSLCAGCTGNERSGEIPRSLGTARTLMVVND